MKNSLNKKSYKKPETRVIIFNYKEIVMASGGDENESGVATDKETKEEL